jgi:hypothetical protein
MSIWAGPYHAGAIYASGVRICVAVAQFWGRAAGESVLDSMSPGRFLFYMFHVGKLGLLISKKIVSLA